MEIEDQQWWDIGYAAYREGHERVPPFGICQNDIDCWLDGWDNAQFERRAGAVLVIGLIGTAVVMGLWCLLR